MEYPRQLHWLPTESDAGRQFASLIHMKTIAEDVAGRGLGDASVALDHGARISAAYDAAVPVAQKRFDALAAEATSWATAAAQALLGDGNSHPSPAAAERLAEELARAQREMERLLGLSS